MVQKKKQKNLSTRSSNRYLFSWWGCLKKSFSQIPMEAFQEESDNNCESLNLLQEAEIEFELENNNVQ